MSASPKLNMSGPVKHPWADSEVEECRDLGVRFAEQGSLDMRALVSFPGSGNTWLRWLERWNN